MEWLMAACILSSNVVMFNQNDKKASMYRCESNKDGTDWNYGWQKNLSAPHSLLFAYVLPHPSTPKCHNSYLIRVTWYPSVNIHDYCPNNIIINKPVNDVETCITIGCDKQADILEFTDNRMCRIMFNCKSEFYNKWIRYFPNKGPIAYSLPGRHWHEI
ncbi:unnamed protein product, partial [Owenia fusiformis]